MSCYWDIGCYTCPVSEYGTPAAHVGFDLNHAGDALAEMLDMRDVLTSLGRHLAAAHEYAYKLDGCGTSQDAYTRTARFLAEHAGHDVAPFSEYGDRWSRCNERIDCPACGHRRKCRLDKGHTDEHSHDRPGER